MKFQITEVQTVEHTYVYTVELPDEEYSYDEAMSEALCAGIPDDTEHSSRLLTSDDVIECLHTNQYVNDRSLFVCKDCDEELGR